MAGPDLGAAEAIPEADDLYNYAVLLEENGKRRNKDDSCTNKL